MGQLTVFDIVVDGVTDVGVEGTVDVSGGAGVGEITVSVISTVLIGIELSTSSTVNALDIPCLPEETPVNIID
jgi:hypothetical protein